MPNARRRRFSVKRNISINNSNKLQCDSNTSSRNENKSKENTQPPKPDKSKNKLYPTGSKLPPQLDIVFECESSHAFSPEKVISADKDVMATSSNIDFYNTLNLADDNHENCETNKRNVPRRDKYLRHHRVKVRSPKRRVISEDNNSDSNNVNHDHITESLDAINWEQEFEETIEMPIPTANVNEEPQVTNQNKPSDHNHINSTNQNPPINQNSPTNQIHSSNNSLDDMCRICHGGESLSELGQMISACGCRGTVGRVHVKCLERWLTESGKSRCELCGTRYSTRRVHKYGFPKALAIWVLSQNAKQLMVDSLGIMLMSPLAVVAAWLSGRTLAGLMVPESQQTPWPLASTFVLACLTLVCYYCWIVSAVTRHALGWWIWYRSQYEVRLQLQDDHE